MPTPNAISPIITSLTRLKPVLDILDNERYSKRGQVTEADLHHFVAKHSEIEDQSNQLCLGTDFYRNSALVQFEDYKDRLQRLRPDQVVELAELHLLKAQLLLQRVKATESPQELKAFYFRSVCNTNMATKLLKHLVDRDLEPLRRTFADRDDATFQKTMRVLQAQNDSADELVNIFLGRATGMETLYGFDDEHRAALKPFHTEVLNESIGIQRVQLSNDPGFNIINPIIAHDFIYPLDSVQEGLSNNEVLFRAVTYTAASQAQGLLSFVTTKADFDETKLKVPTIEVLNVGSQAMLSVLRKRLEPISSKLADN